jgi:hypothetical protein
VVLWLCRALTWVLAFPLLMVAIGYRSRPRHSLVVAPNNAGGKIIALSLGLLCVLIDLAIWCYAGLLFLAKRWEIQWEKSVPPEPPPKRHEKRRKLRRLRDACLLMLSLPCIQGIGSVEARGFVAQKVHCGNWNPSERTTLRSLLESAHGTDIAGVDAIRSVVDTGCSGISTPNPKDFIDGSYTRLAKKTMMGGIGSGLEIQGSGLVKYQVLDTYGRIQEIAGRAWHIDQLPVRLIPPQQVMRDAGIGDYCINGEDGGRFVYANGGGVVRTPLDPATGLPMLTMFHDAETSAENFEAGLYSCVTAEANQNLTPTQKEVLRWHARLGHSGMNVVTWLGRRGLMGSQSKRIGNLKAEDHPKCATCQYGKQVRRPTGSTHTTIRPEADGGIRHGKLFPGDEIAVDQFEVTKRGRKFKTGGREKETEKFSGGTIFVDVATGYTKLYFQVSLGGEETIRAKLEFERHALSCGVLVKAYRSDNGIFTKEAFMNEIATNHQSITASGVGAHHQNGCAERAIRTVVTKARVQLLHAQLRWPEQTPSDLWPMAMQHSEHLLNIIPSTTQDGYSAEERFCRAFKSTPQLAHLPVWGSPAYVLDPTLQDGRKLPKWRPRSRRGQFVGWSPLHSSKVALIRNLTTGRISPQFHVIFDNWFETVYCDEEEEEPPDWDIIVTSSQFESQVDREDLAGLELDDEWLSKEELNDRRRVERARAPSMSDSPVQEGASPAIPDSVYQPQDESARPQRRESSLGRDLTSEFEDAAMESPTIEQVRRERHDTRANPGRRTESPVPRTSMASPDVHPRRSKRHRKAPDRLGFEGTGVSGYLSLMNYVRRRASEDRVSAECAVAYWTLMHMNPDSGEVDDIDGTFTEMAFAAAKRKKRIDPDTPNYREAITGPHKKEFEAAMAKEIRELVAKETWHAVLRSSVPPSSRVIPLTWVMKIKRLPNGELDKFKARICVRGDLQEETRETYAPVVKWTTIRSVLAFSVKNNLKTRQVDFVNAFVQSKIPKGEDVYVELPPGMEHDGHEKGSTVLKLDRSLYGMTRSPLLWFGTLKAALEKMGYHQSSNDQCLFIDKKTNSIIVVYVDDCLCFAREDKVLDDLVSGLRGLGLFLDEECISDDVYAYLGVEINLQGDVVEMLQTGLIDKVLRTVGMENATPNLTPAKEAPLGKDKSGPEFRETWDYSSVVGMLSYLVHTRPDIQFAVNQCARFGADPRESHGNAVKKICRYLAGTKRKGLCFKNSPTSQDGRIRVDCFVDASFAADWAMDDPMDPDSAKSRSGYIIKVDDCPIAFASRKQGETALSTTESEYVALSVAMRELIWIRRMVAEVADGLNVDYNKTTRIHSKVFEDNQGAIAVAKRPDLTARTRHILTKYHHFKESLGVDEHGDGIVLEYCPTEDQQADLFTKGVGIELFVRLRDRLMGWHLCSKGHGELEGELKYSSESTEDSADSSIGMTRVNGTKTQSTSTTKRGSQVRVGGSRSRDRELHKTAEPKSPRPSKTGTCGNEATESTEV